MQNDNEIIKALKCCINDDCDNCPDTFGNCEHNVMRNALDLINRQKEQIKRLENIERLATKTIEKQEAEIERYKGVIKLLERDVANAKTEGVKEFAHLLIDKAEPGGLFT